MSESTVLETADTPSVSTQQAPFLFHGEGWEYFRIWIVNLALTIVTLGVYSPWAKVRNRQYLYGNTELAGHRFQYTADPIKILYGRIIAVAILLLYFFSSLNPIVGLVMGLVMIVFWPWAVTRGLMFNARYSEYRGLNFAFSGSTLDVFVLFFLAPPLTALTFGLALPWVFAKQKEYVVSRHWFGRQSFDLTLPKGKVYWFCFSLILAAFFGLIGGIALLYPTVDSPGDHSVVGMLIAGLFYLGLIVMYPIFRIGMMELAFRHAKLGDIHFESSLSWSRAITIIATNQLLVILTLGLFLPFAKVRWANYRASTLNVVPAEAIDGFVAEQQEEVGAVGAESGDIFDVDLALGL